MVTKIDFRRPEGASIFRYEADRVFMSEQRKSTTVLRLIR